MSKDPKDDKAYKAGMAILDSGKYEYVIFEYKGAPGIWHQIHVEDSVEKGPAYEVRENTFDEKDNWGVEKVSRIDKAALMKMLEEKKDQIRYMQSEYVGGEGDTIMVGNHD